MVTVDVVPSFRAARVPVPGFVMLIRLFFKTLLVFESSSLIPMKFPVAAAASSPEMTLNEISGAVADVRISIPVKFPVVSALAEISLLKTL